MIYGPRWDLGSEKNTKDIIESVNNNYELQIR